MARSAPHVLRIAIVGCGAIAHWHLDAAGVHTLAMFAVMAACAVLTYEFVGVMLVGGTEKLRGMPDYGVPRRIKLLAEIPQKETLKSDV